MSNVKGLIFGIALVSSVVIAALALEPTARPSPMRCEDLKDYNERNFCWAVTRDDPRFCERIYNEEIHTRCQAFFRDGSRP